MSLPPRLKAWAVCVALVALCSVAILAASLEADGLVLDRSSEFAARQGVEDLEREGIMGLLEEEDGAGSRKERGFVGAYRTSEMSFDDPEALAAVDTHLGEGAGRAGLFEGKIHSQTSITLASGGKPGEKSEGSLEEEMGETDDVSITRGAYTTEIMDGDVGEAASASGQGFLESHGSITFNDAGATRKGEEAYNVEVEAGAVKDASLHTTFDFSFTSPRAKASFKNTKAPAAKAEKIMSESDLGQEELSSRDEHHLWELKPDEEATVTSTRSTRSLLSKIQVEAGDLQKVRKPSRPERTCKLPDIAKPMQAFLVKGRAKYASDDFSNCPRDSWENEDAKGKVVSPQWKGVDKGTVHKMAHWECKHAIQYRRGGRTPAQWCSLFWAQKYCAGTCCREGFSPKVKGKNFLPIESYQYPVKNSYTQLDCTPGYKRRGYHVKDFRSPRYKCIDVDGTYTFAPPFNPTGQACVKDHCMAPHLGHVGQEIRRGFSVASRFDPAGRTPQIRVEHKEAIKVICAHGYSAVQEDKIRSRFNKVVNQDKIKRGIKSGEIPEWNLNMNLKRMQPNSTKSTCDPNTAKLTPRVDPMKLRCIPLTDCPEFAERDLTCSSFKAREAKQKMLPSVPSKLQCKQVPRMPSEYAPVAVKAMLSSSESKGFGCGDFRLRGKGAWCFQDVQPHVNLPKTPLMHYMQLDLGRTMRIGGVKTAGFKGRWLKKYRMSISEDGLKWWTSTDCVGNADESKQVTNSIMLAGAQKARYVRLHVVEASSTMPVVRLEVWAKPIPGESSEELGDEFLLQLADDKKKMKTGTTKVETKTSLPSTIPVGDLEINQAHFVKHKGKNCAGVLYDAVVKFPSKKMTVSGCKNLCSKLGKHCSGFVFIKSGRRKDQCKLRSGKTTVDTQKFLWDDRDCYEKGCRVPDMEYHQHYNEVMVAVDSPWTAPLAKGSILTNGTFVRLTCGGGWMAMRKETKHQCANGLIVPLPLPGSLQCGWCHTTCKPLKTLKRALPIVGHGMKWMSKPKHEVTSKQGCDDHIYVGAAKCAASPVIPSGKKNVYCGCAAATHQVELRNEFIAPNASAATCKAEFRQVVSKEKSATKSMDSAVAQYNAAWAKSCAALPASWKPFLQSPKQAPAGVEAVPPRGFEHQNGHMVASLGDPAEGLVWSNKRSSYVKSNGCQNAQSTTAIAWCDVYAQWQINVPIEQRGKFKCGCQTPYQKVERIVSGTVSKSCQAAVISKAGVPLDIGTQLLQWGKLCLHSDAATAAVRQQALKSSNKGNTLGEANEKPCVVTKTTGCPGIASKLVAVLKKPQFPGYHPTSQVLAKCKGGFTMLSGSNPSIQKIAGRGGGEVVKHCDKCAQLCAYHKTCKAYQCSASKKKCFLHDTMWPIAGAKGDYNFCAKGVQCDTGFTALVGKAPTWGTIEKRGGGEAVGKCADCADLCNKRPSCQSYACSHTTKKCALNLDPNPATKPFADYSFCAKGPCGNGYIAMSGDIAGMGKIDDRGGGEKMSDCVECGRLCDKNKYCKSYQCSAETKACKMNTFGSPTAPAFKDFSFCQKMNLMPGSKVELSGGPNKRLCDNKGSTIRCDSKRPAKTNEYKVYAAEGGMIGLWSSSSQKYCAADQTNEMSLSCNLEALEVGNMNGKFRVLDNNRGGIGLQTADKKLCAPDADNIIKCNQVELVAETSLTSQCTSNCRGDAGTAWEKAIVQQSANDTCTMGTDLGKATVDSMFEASGSFRYDVDGSPFAYYKRLTTIPPGLSVYNLMLKTWKVKSPGNVFNKDFKLYSSEADMDADRDAWEFCNGEDPGVGFPRECGPNLPIQNKWAAASTRYPCGKPGTSAFFIKSSNQAPGGLASIMKGGDGFIELGMWRFGRTSDGHFVFSHRSGYTPVDFSPDGSMTRGPVREYNLWNDTMINTREAKMKNVVIGNAAIEFGGIWRLAAVGSHKLTLSHKSGETAVLWTKSGRQFPGPSSKGSGWTQPFHPAGAVGIGDRFLQIGPSFRVGDVDGKHFAVSYTKAEKSVTSVLYNSDGTMMPGPDKAFGLWGRRISSSEGSAVQKINKKKVPPTILNVPDAPKGFKWAPQTQSKGAPWPHKKTYMNPGGCIATFWLGLAYCSTGDTKRAVIKSPSGGHPTSLDIGFGCPNGERVKTLVTGSTHDETSPECAAQFVKWDAVMQVKVEGLTNSPEARAINSAFLQVIRQGDSVHRPVPANMAVFMPPKVMAVVTAKCNMTASVRVLGCKARPHVPVMYSKTGMFYDNKLVGCGCAGDLLNVQVFGTIGWMRDTSVKMQEHCTNLHIKMMADVKGILSNMNTSPKVLEDYDEYTLKRMNKIVRRAAWEMQGSCAKMRAANFKNHAMDALSKQVDEHVFYTNKRIELNERREKQADKAQLQRVVWEEKNAKNVKFEVERLVKQQKWDEEKYGKQKALAEVATKRKSEVSSKEKVMKTKNAKYTRQEKDLKAVVQKTASKRGKDRRLRQAARSIKKRHFLENKSKQAKIEIEKQKLALKGAQQKEGELNEDEKKVAAALKQKRGTTLVAAEGADKTILGQASDRSEMLAKKLRGMTSLKRGKECSVLAEEITELLKMAARASMDAGSAQKKREAKDFLAQVGKKGSALAKLLRSNGEEGSATEASAIRDMAVNFKGQSRAHVSTTGSSTIVDPNEISKMLSGLAEITSDIAETVRSMSDPAKLQSVGGVTKASALAAKVDAQGEVLEKVAMALNAGKDGSVVKVVEGYGELVKEMALKGLNKVAKKFKAVTTLLEKVAKSSVTKADLQTVVSMAKSQNAPALSDKDNVKLTKLENTEAKLSGEDEELKKGNGELEYNLKRKKKQEEKLQKEVLDLKQSVLFTGKDHGFNQMKNMLAVYHEKLTAVRKDAKKAARRAKTNIDFNEAHEKVLKKQAENAKGETKQDAAMEDLQKIADRADGKKVDNKPKTPAPTPSPKDALANLLKGYTHGLKKMQKHAKGRGAALL